VQEKELMKKELMKKEKNKMGKAMNAKGKMSHNTRARKRANEKGEK
jgi:hypothetical protein